ncbi:pollen receptor-like kinase 3 [Punica granatum]|uniref:Protein kinase domain-containing protein n=2 Tax=Punica granatum TaxID=22663 RepID=A0A218WNM2_PUNGR|nr:pollen receptor-like kinase 3 [Punica granatum]OWM74385.1 hypothetical protein CDL15_Pgr013289 [Punica granatum]PKI34993.1 hypothetical protein CRG98_044624 [Punica granatum]
MAAVRTLRLILILWLASLSVSDPEADALLRLKQSFQDDNEALGSWVASSHPCSGWKGVVCFNNIITGLHLSDLGLAGKIDAEALLLIRSLRTISFVNNDFSGPIPEFNRLGALKSLLLSKNHFSGEIPADFFSRMSSLKKVWLSQNNFTGSIPKSLTQLPNLMELHLEQNQFSGTIPSMEREKLVSLDLSYNKLEGKIPDGVSKFGPNSFKGNEGLCGKPLTTICSDPTQKPPDDMPTPSSSPQDETKKTGQSSQMIIWTVFGLLAAGVLLSAIYNSRKRETQFSILGKEVVHDAVEVHISSRGSSGRKGSMSKRGSSRGGSKHDIGDLIIVNGEKGTFGLSDLMKAAAEVLGNGGLGSAYKAVMTNGLAVVVKRLREMNRLGREGLDAEMRKFGSLRHQNILTPLAYHYRKEEKLLVSEYIPKGSLLYVLHGDRGDFHAELTWPTRLKIIQGIARGLDFLHSEFASYDLPHGNLKSSNVLLGDNYEPLLSDYAFHPFINAPQAAQTMFAYKAPEYVQYQQLTPKCDVYCLGIIILEILTGKFPSQYLNNGKGGTDVVQWVQSAISENREVEVINPEIATSTGSTNEMLKLLHIGASCTESNPELRPDLREATRRIEEVQV